ncbi:MAG: PAS domain-containing protein [Planctomycetota bacterium]|jgi:PAS domain-containing protein
MGTKVDHILDAIVQGTAPCTGATFFRALVQNLARAMGMKYAFTAEVLRSDEDDSPATVRTLAYWVVQDFEANFEYPLAGTPCERVVGGESLEIDENVRALFPTDGHLVELGAESYYGVPLVNEDGVCLGHLAVLDDKPVSGDYDRLAVLRTFAARALAELERAHLESQLRVAEGHFRLLFEASPNPVILFDLDTHIERIRGTGGDTFEAYHKTKKGTPVHVIVTLRIVSWDGREVMLTIWHDITERKQMEAALRQSEARFSGTVESAMDAIVTLDGQRRVLLFNSVQQGRRTGLRVRSGGDSAPTSGSPAVPTIL